SLLVGRDQERWKSEPFLDVLELVHFGPDFGGGFAFYVPRAEENSSHRSLGDQHLDGFEAIETDDEGPSPFLEFCFGRRQYQPLAAAGAEGSYREPGEDHGQESEYALFLLLPDHEIGSEFGVVSLTEYQSIFRVRNMTKAKMTKSPIDPMSNDPSSAWSKL